MSKLDEVFNLSDEEMYWDELDWSDEPVPPQDDEEWIQSIEDEKNKLPN
jgi:hypothetical protein